MSCCVGQRHFSYGLFFAPHSCDELDCLRTCRPKIAKLHELQHHTICQTGERVEKAREMFCSCKATGLVQALALHACSLSGWYGSVYCALNAITHHCACLKQALRGEDLPPAQPDASVRFRSSVTTPDKFAGKFGRYSTPDASSAPKASLTMRADDCQDFAANPADSAAEGKMQYANCDDTARGLGRLPSGAGTLENTDIKPQEALSHTIIPNQLDASQRYADATARGSTEFARRFGHYAGETTAAEGLDHGGRGSSLTAGLSRVSANLRRASLGSQHERQPPDGAPNPEFTVRAVPSSPPEPVR